MIQGAGANVRRSGGDSIPDLWANTTAGLREGGLRSASGLGVRCRSAADLRVSGGGGPDLSSIGRSSSAADLGVGGAAAYLGIGSATHPWKTDGTATNLRLVCASRVNADAAADFI